MAYPKNYKTTNSKWTEKKSQPTVKNRIPHHPWNDTNRFIKAHHEKIWTQIITPENEALIKSKEKKAQ